MRNVKIYIKNTRTEERREVIVAVEGKLPVQSVERILRTGAVIYGKGWEHEEISVTAIRECK